MYLLHSLNPWPLRRLRNATDVRGCIVVTRRGESSFVEKAEYAEQAGAIAVVIANTPGKGMLAPRDPNGQGASVCAASVAPCPRYAKRAPRQVRASRRTQSRTLSRHLGSLPAAVLQVTIPVVGVSGSADISTLLRADEIEMDLPTRRKQLSRLGGGSSAGKTVKYGVNTLTALDTMQP